MITLLFFLLLCLVFISLCSFSYTSAHPLSAHLHSISMRPSQDHVLSASTNSPHADDPPISASPLGLMFCQLLWVLSRMMCCLLLQAISKPMSCLLPQAIFGPMFCLLIQLTLGRYPIRFCEPAHSGLMFYALSRAHSETMFHLLLQTHSRPVPCPLLWYLFWLTHLFLRDFSGPFPCSLLQVHSWLMSQLVHLGTGWSSWSHIGMQFGSSIFSIHKLCSLMSVR